MILSLDVFLMQNSTIRRTGVALVVMNHGMSDNHEIYTNGEKQKFHFHQS